MMIDDFRKAHPEYDDMDTPTLCRCLHAKHYADMPKEEFDRAFIGRPNHDDLGTAAVRGNDSLELQDADPTIKPAVKMTLEEFTNAQIPPEKPFFSPGNGIVYVFASNTADIESAIGSILSGNDSELLGYPPPGCCDCCVTKDGRVIHDLPTMHDEAKKGNVAWAASGDHPMLGDMAEKVGASLRGR
jgi:hypothetical protein